VAWLISVGVSGFALLCLGGWIYEKARKKILHPKLGPLVYDWGTWSGLMAHYNSGEASVRFELPGSKEGPSPEQCEEFLKFWDGIQGRVAEAREMAVEEFLELRDAYDEDEESDFLNQIVQACSDDTFEKHWSLVGVSRSLNESYVWSLEFEVAWDPEHTRSAYFDSTGRLKGYALSCAAPFDDDE
jgi:uncharacterized protein DUF6985